MATPNARTTYCSGCGFTPALDAPTYHRILIRVTTAAGVDEQCDECLRANLSRLVPALDDAIGLAPAVAA